MLKQLRGSVIGQEFRRIARILEIIQLISISPRRWKRRTLAEKYGISERQIQKDLRIIREALHLPLQTYGDGYYFEKLPSLPTVSYTFSEALALLLAARMAQAIPGVNSAELAAAIARLESLFPEEFVPLLRQSAERLPRSAKAPHRQEMLTLLHRALAERRQVRIIYAIGAKGGEESERVIEPYHIIPYVRSWQLIAYCHKKQAVLMFKIDRIRQAELLDETYTIPSDFDIDEYLGDNWGLMRGAAREPEDVELIFDPIAGRWVAEEHWHKSQQVETLPNGSVRVRFYIGITPEFVNWLLYYGSRVRVVKPEWLREQVVKEHKKAAEMHNNEGRNVSDDSGDQSAT